MISTTNMPKQSFSFTAIFEGVSGYPTEKLNSPIDSGKFEFNGITWFLRLFPGGTTYSTNTYTYTKAADPSKASSCFGVYIYSSRNVRASYSIALKPAGNSLYMKDLKRTDKRDLLGGYGYGWPDFVSSSVGLTCSDYNKNDSITFVCEITIFDAVQISMNINNKLC